jgi:hypothetical protein
MEHSMKILLATVALGAVLAVPAFAQAPNTRQEAQTSRHTVWHGNRNANPDFQLGYSR